MWESFLTIPLFSRIIFSGSLNSQRFDKHSSQNIPTSLSNNTYPSHLSLPRLFPPTTRYQLSSLNTLAQRYVKSRDIECSLSREDTSRPSTKSEMIFFFLHFQAECEQRVDDVTQGGGFRPVLMSESPPKETAKKAGTMVSAKRVHRWWDEGKRDKRKRRKGGGRGAESFATTSAERYYRR